MHDSQALQHLAGDLAAVEFGQGRVFVEICLEVSAVIVLHGNTQRILRLIPPQRLHKVFRVLSVQVNNPDHLWSTDGRAGQSQLAPSRMSTYPFVREPRDGVELSDVP